MAVRSRRSRARKARRAVRAGTSGAPATPEQLRYMMGRRASGANDRHVPDHLKGTRRVHAGRAVAESEGRR